MLTLPQTDPPPVDLPPATDKASSPQRSSTFLLLALILLPWFLLFHHLHVEWLINPYYHWGWGVPFLSLYLLWRRWKLRPERSAAVIPAGVMIPMVATCLVYLPVRLIGEANPDWRLFSWLLAMTVCALTLCVAYVAGGRSWLKFFAFPLCFPLLAVPWPTLIEQPLTQSLMQLVTFLCVEILNVLAIPALQQGNVIETAGGVVAINDACSGIKSFQAAVVLGFLLGEVFWLRWHRRLFLILAGAVLAFLTNLLRAFTLVLLAERGGASALGTWHDQTGFSVLFVCFLALLFLADRLRGQAPVPGIRLAFRLPLPLPVAVPALAFLCLICSEAAVKGWYRYHERSLSAPAAWSFRPTVKRYRLEKMDIPVEVEALLRCNRAEAWSWRDGANARWWTFFLRWNAGRASAQLAQLHSPEVCLPATGRTLVQGPEEKEFTSGSVRLPFRYYRFREDDTYLHIYYCLWEDRLRGSEPGAFGRALTANSRLAAVVEGKRNLGRQVLEIAVRSNAEEARVDHAVAELLPSVVKASGE